ncbi:MAG: hypothetical protein SFT90_08060 [Rickettsiales bacterium]|nr:hypothetical protein [Rickettsiales bacterium]
MQNFLLQIQPQQAFQNAQIKFSGSKLSKFQLNYTNEPSAKYRPEGFALDFAEIDLGEDDSKKNFPIRLEVFPHTQYGFSEPIFSKDKSSYHIQAENPYMEGLISDYVDKYFGSDYSYYREVMYQSKLLEQGGKLEEYQYVRYSLGEKIDQELYIKFDIAMMGEGSNLRNYKILENQISIYDLINNKTITIKLDSNGMSVTSPERDMNKSEIAQIRNEANELRKNIDGKYQKVTPADYVPVYEKHNPIQKSDDGKGSIDLDKLQEKVKQMTEGYKLEVKNEALYANIENGIDSKSRA